MPTVLVSWLGTDNRSGHWEGGGGSVFGGQPLNIEGQCWIVIKTHPRERLY